MRARVGERKVRLPLITRRPAKACSGSGGSQQELYDVTVGCGRVSGLLRQAAAGRPNGGHGDGSRTERITHCHPRRLAFLALKHARTPAAKQTGRLPIHKMEWAGGPIVLNGCMR